MEQYRHKTPLATSLDRLLLRLVVVGFGLGWFLFLWGVTLPAFTAGFAFGCLLWLSLRRFEALSIQRKEKQLRRSIGGEMALDRLLLLPSRHAAFQTVLWLGSKVPLEMQRTTDSGVLCHFKGKTALVQLIAQHKSMNVTVQQVIDAHKECMRHRAARCIICLTAPLSREAKAYAETAMPPIKLVPREEMLKMAGQASPATDEELSGMAERGRRPLGWRRWVEHVLSPGRAKGYFVYGLGLAMLYLVTGLWYYSVPAVICLILCVLCRWYKPKDKEEEFW
ncbi:MAG: hypothetical protein VB099_06025 [Candidatus Limiplasma sp.]|nr:hypothetical protein [Candidatus Limiplasma sp.]